MQTRRDFAPNLFVSIASTGQVTIVVSRSEMGTGIRTSLAMVLADELDADWQDVHVVQAQGDVKYGDQNTDGSKSIRLLLNTMREAGATARQMLLDRRGASLERRAVSLPHRGRRRRSRCRGQAPALCRVGGRCWEAADAAARFSSDEGAGCLALHRQADADSGSRRHRTGQCGFRYRRDAARDEVRLDRTSTELWRSCEKLRCEGGPEGVRRGTGGGNPGCAATIRLQAAGRRRRHREQHLGRDAGASETADRVGARAQRGL